jgi:hypothetical protein
MIDTRHGQFQWVLRTLDEDGGITIVLHETDTTTNGSEQHD